MKKRFSALFLALALCLGLAVPAMATSTTQVKGLEETSQYSLTIRHPDDYTVTHKTATYQMRFLRTFSSDQDRFFVYDKETSSPVLDMTYVPLGADIVISGLSAANERIELKAWSDPDGDGIYDMRLIVNDSFPHPLADSYSQPFDTKFLDYDCLHISSGYNSDHTAVTITADSLYQLYGANTIFAMGITDPRSSEAKPANPVPGTTIENSEYSDTQVFVFLLTDENVSTPAFTDVPAWCADAVNWAVGAKVTDGVGGGKFAPTRSCTHEQILTFLYRAEGKPPYSAKAPFTVDAAYADAVNWAYGEEIIGRSFDPKAGCTRADAVTYIWRALGSQKAGTASFSDVPDGTDYAAAVNWAVANGVVEGYTDGTFRPGSVCNRGAIATGPMSPGPA